jgi:AcrR family transcriptional regulator
MNTLTPSALKICEAAMGHFADSGSAAASLSKIAETVGIRKASIYAHFSGKDELFMESYRIALYEESVFLRNCFEKDKSSRVLPGYEYCKAAKKKVSQFLVIPLPAGWSLFSAADP